MGFKSVQNIIINENEVSIGKKSMRIKDKRSLSLGAYLSHICDRLYRLRHSSIWQEAEEQCCAQHGTAVEEWLSSKKYCKTRSKLRGKGKWVHSACTFYALIPSFCFFYKVEATSSPQGMATSMVVFFWWLFNLQSLENAWRFLLLVSALVRDMTRPAFAYKILTF